MAQYDVDLREYWQIICKRKIYIFILVFTVGIVSYGFAKFKEPVPLFEAVAAIKIDRSTNMAAVLTGTYWQQSENMETHAYIIKSFPILVQVGKSLKIFPKELSIEEIRNNKNHLATINQLKEKVEAEYQSGTNIIDIKIVSESPFEAAATANAFANAYRRYNVEEKNKKTYETKTFIEEQLQATSKKLKEAEQKLQEFKKGYALISMDVQTQKTLDKLYAVESEWEKIKADKEEILAQLQMFAAKKDDPVSQFKEIFLTTGPNSPLFAHKKKISELFLQRQTLLINFTVNHPQVKEIDDQIKAILFEAKKELKSRLKTLEFSEKKNTAVLHQLREENQQLPQKALHLVRLERDVDLQASLYSQLKEKHQETLIQESSKIEEVSIVKPAVPPNKPSNIPSKLILVSTGLVIGLVIGVLFAFLAEVFDTSMGKIEDVENLLEMPVLGIIPALGAETGDQRRKKPRDPEKTRTRDLVTHFKPDSMGAEAFRALRTNLQFLRLETKGKAFLITSAFVQEGKTVNAINLALIMAQAGNKVLLVDADLRKPLIHKYYGLSMSPGLTDHVLGNYHRDEITNTISDIMLGDFGIDDILITPGMDTLHIITAGTKPPNPSEILNSTRFKNFLKEASNDYDFVFIDAPPVIPVADASDIASLADGVILVYMTGKIGRSVLKRVKATLENVDATLTGVILNKVKAEVGPEYYRYHSYSYDGGESGLNPPKKLESAKQKIINKSKPKRVT